MGYSESRRFGMAFEPVAGEYVRRRLGLARAGSAGETSPSVRQLLAALDRHPSVSVGKNSTVEGIWEDKDGRAVLLEASGSVEASRVPGASRADTARKLLGSAAAVAFVCRAEGVPAPHYLIVTTALPARGSSAAGWVWALLLAVEQELLGGIDIHVIDRNGNPVADLTAAELRSYYQRPAA